MIKFQEKPIKQCMNSKTVERKKWHINKGTKNLTYPQKSMTGGGGKYSEKWDKQKPVITTAQTHRIYQ